MSKSQTEHHIKKVCEELAAFLIKKNRAYGDSALDPVRCFSKAATDEQINVRIDDKLSRLMRGAAAGEDVEKDLLGYLILKQVWRRLQSFPQVTADTFDPPPVPPFGGGPSR